MSLWPELCYMFTPTSMGGYKSKHLSNLLIWKQHRRKELGMCTKLGFLVLSQGLLESVEAVKTFLQVKSCLEAYLEKLIVPISPEEAPSPPASLPNLKHGI